MANQDGYSPTKLANLCLDVITTNFDRFIGKHASADKFLAKNFEFLHKAYSKHLLKELANTEYFPKYMDYSLKKHLEKVNAGLCHELCDDCLIFSLSSMLETQFPESPSNEVLDPEVNEQEKPTFLNQCVAELTNLLVSKIKKHGLAVKLRDEVENRRCLIILIRNLKHKIKFLEKSQILIIYEKMKNVHSSAESNPTRAGKQVVFKVNLSTIQSEPSTLIEQQKCDLSIMRPERLSKEQGSEGEMMNSIKHLYLQMLEWVELHIRFLPNYMGHILRTSFFRWTEDSVSGVLMIDKKGTAESLVSKELLDVSKNYELACEYCFKDLIERLWGKLDPTEQNAYRENKDVLPLIKFWASRKKVRGMKSKDYEHLLRSVARLRNEVALEYLLNDLHEITTRPNLVYLAVPAATAYSNEYFYNRNTPVLCKFLDVMNDEERNKFYEKYGSYVLYHLVGLPLYKETVDSIWKDDLPYTVCRRLLHSIACNVSAGYGYHKEIFIEYYNIIREKNNGICEILLLDLFTFDKEIFEKIWSNSTFDEKKTITTYAANRKLWEPKQCNYDLLQVIIEKCLDTKEKKEEFMKNLISVPEGLEVYAYLAKNNQLSEFEKLRNKYLGEVNEFSMFKKLFFEIKASGVFVSLCRENTKEPLNNFLVWYLSDIENSNVYIKESKQEIALLCRSIETIINFVLRRLGWGPYIKWNALKKYNFFIFCKREEFKSVIRVYVDLLLEQEKRGLAGLFLHWYFLVDRDIVTFKESFINEQKVVNFCISNIKVGKQLVVGNFLEWAKLPEEELKRLFEKCNNSLEKQEDKEALNRAFDYVLSGKRQPVRDGSTQKQDEKRRNLD